MFIHEKINGNTNYFYFNGMLMVSLKLSVRESLMVEIKILKTDIVFP